MPLARCPPRPRPGEQHGDIACERPYVVWLQNEGPIPDHLDELIYRVLKFSLQLLFKLSFLCCIRWVGEMTLPARRRLRRGSSVRSLALLISPKPLRARDWIIKGKSLQKLLRYCMRLH